MTTERTISFRNSLVGALMALAALPVVVFSTFLIIQFSDIQEQEQLQKFSAQANNVVQSVEFDIAFFYNRFTQYSNDNVLAIAAQTGTFGERARMKMDQIRVEHPLVGALMLVDDQIQTLSAVPTVIELLDASDLRQYASKTLTNGKRGVVDAHLVESPRLAKALREFGVTQVEDVESHYVLIFAAPLVLADSRISDTFAKTTGVLLAVMPIENIFNALQYRAASMNLENITLGGIEMNSELPGEPGDVIEVGAAFSVDGIEQKWDATFSRNREESLRSVNKLMERYIMIAAIFVALLLIASFGLSRLFLSPLEALAELIAQYLKRDYRPTYKDLYFREVQEIVEVLAAMAEQIQLDRRELEDRVEERTADLSKANDELSNAMEQLTITQEKLVDQEKKSLVGQLVAGIAHEINTPLGICVTAGSTLSETLDNLKAAYHENKVSRKMFEDFFEEFGDGFRIMQTNHQRAAMLMQNFKLIAVDSASEQKREFNLHSYIEETLHSLAPELRVFNVKTTVEGDRRLNLDSYPGAYAQIITNLVLNSLRHAFKKEQQHHIRISFSIAGSSLHLVYRDDGCGVDEHQLKKLFDPFYTTLSNKGGSGLGLNIISNIVTMTLKGKVQAESIKGHGLSFIFALPLFLEDEEVK